MTINTTASRITYAGNGSTTAWTFPFPGVSPTFIQVFTTDSSGNVIQQPSNAYTVSLNPPIDPNPTSIGGIVNFPLSGPALAVGNSITIQRVLPATQSTSLENQGTLYPTVIEQALDYLTMLDQSGATAIDRSFKVSISDPIPADVPSVATRKNQWAFFDSNGNLSPGATPSGTVIISAAMQPVVSAATIPLAQVAFGLGTTGYSAISGIKLPVAGTYTIANADKGKTIVASGGYYTITIGTASGYDVDFQVFIYNSDTRGKLIAIPGFANFIAWPNQFVLVTNTGTAWMASVPGRWKPPGATNFYVDPALGNDNNDGLAAGAGAFQTIQKAVSTLEQLCDGNFTINLANGTHNVGSGVICTMPVPGSDGYKIVGNVGNPDLVILNAADGGTCIQCQDNTAVTIDGVLISGASAACAGITATRGAIVNVGAVNCGSVWRSGITTQVSAHFYCVNNATMAFTKPYHVHAGANANYHMFTIGSGTILYNPGTVTFDGSVSFPAAFVVALYESTIWQGVGVGAQSFINPGFVSATQYNVAYNSFVTFGGATCPGNVAGTTSAGGYFA